MMDTPTHTLDPAQEVRIEAVHSGFLYQHLYGVACLFAAARLGATGVVVERDEDIEVVSGTGRAYVQVKKRNRPIIRSDIQSAFDRFELLREEHRLGRRPGAASFAVVVNQRLGTELAADESSQAIPSDVELIWPGKPSSINFGSFPPAWSTIDEAVAWCTQEASTIPLAMLAPDSLVWKLAGRILSAAAGTAPHADHSFAASDLPVLFEQLLVQMQDFPSPPLQYRPQADEPAIETGARVRIVSGFSGAGKTAWASQAATYSRNNCAYFDCAETPGEAIPLTLVRELAAKLVGAKAEGVRQIIRPGASGLESLRALDIYLSQAGLSSTVVLDNVHRVPAESIQRLVNATTSLRIVLLAQPVGSLVEVESLLGLKREALNGWSVDEVAAATSDRGCRGDAEAMARLRMLTAGMPLFVQSAASVALDEYEGGVAECCAAIETLTHLKETAQEVILAKVFKALAAPVQDAVAVLSLCDIGLQPAEVDELLKKALGMTPQAVAAALRSLRAAGVAEVYGGKQIRLHDAIRLVGSQYLATRPPEFAATSRNALKDLLFMSLLRHRETARLSLYARMLLASGDAKPLVELIGEEMFHEIGIATEIFSGLEKLVTAGGLAPEQHYWALDGLVFSDIKTGRLERCAPRFAEMERLLAEGALGHEELVSFTMKRMSYCAQLGDRDGATKAIATLRGLVPDNEVHQRVFFYNAAGAIHSLGQYESALELASQVVDLNYDALGITAKQVHRVQPPEIWRLINQPGLDHADIKRLADALELKAKIAQAQGLIDPFARIQAMKFYGIAGALDSVVRVGQDLAEDFVKRHEFDGAREVLEEHVIPVVISNNLLSHSVDVRAQYAVVLAFCREYAAADREMARLQPYVAGLDPTQRSVFEDRLRIIARAKINPPAQYDPFRVAAQRFARPLPPSRPTGGMKVGRNEPCPCGSGKKFKKCSCGLNG